MMLESENCLMLLNSLFGNAEIKKRAFPPLALRIMGKLELI